MHGKINDSGSLATKKKTTPATNYSSDNRSDTIDDIADFHLFLVGNSRIAG